MADVTPLPTPTATPCACQQYQITIVQSDLDNASGNLDPDLNGTVFWITTNCNGVYEEVPFYDPGVYNGFCVCQQQQFKYYQNDVGYEGYSEASFEGSCCKCYTISNDTFDTLEYEYYLCDGSGPYTISIGGPSIQYVCSRQAPVALNPGLVITGGLDPCNTDSDCSGIGSTSTPTPTPSKTPTFTQTPTPTASSPTYYYYSALICGNPSFMRYFRSTDPNLADHCNVIYGYCDSEPHTDCGGTPQCFDNVSPSMVYNTNDIISCEESCECCQGLCPTQTPTETPAETATQTPTPTPSNTPTLTPTPTNTVTQTQTPTQTITPSQTQTQTTTPTNTTTPTTTPSPTVTIGLTPTATETPTPTNTATPTTTPTNTATPTTTPSNTATPSVTPSSTPILCGNGVTTGNYWYTDCCGVFQQGISTGSVVSLDYTKVFGGITLLNQPATTACVTPTPTQTPSPTTTLTITPTTSPTPTKTPLITPSPTATQTPSPVYRLQNNCDVFTLFDLGVTCNVLKLPSGPNSFDGILTLDVTGGTGPYSFYWTNGQRTKTLTGIGQGLYPVQVVDYYGDYTANTVCSLILPTPTASPTPTVTPSKTPPPVYPNICFFAYSQSNQFGPTTFIQNGVANGRPKWTSSNSQNIVWRNTRWEVVGSDLVTPINPVGGGIFASSTTSLPPLGGWQLLGGTQTYTINVTAGSCPSVIPLQVSVEKQNASCNEQTNCNGSITVSSRFGQPPYEYSINNGVSYQTSNIFTNLCPNTYNVRVRDSLNNISNQQVQITSEGTPQTYQINVITQPQLTTEVTNGSISTKTTYFYVTSVPPIPPGITVSFNLTTSSIKTFNGPGTGTVVDNFTILQNGVPKVPSSTNVTSTTGTRPNCNPQTQRIDTETDQYYLELSSNSTVSGSTTSILTITDGQVAPQTNCTTELIQTISVQISDVNAKGCACCSAVGDTTQTQVNSNSISFEGTIVEPECVTCQGKIIQGPIYLDMNLIVGGLICTGPNRTGCFQNFRYSATGGNLSLGSGLSSYPCGISPNSNVLYMQANFQTPTSDNYYVKATAYLNGTEVGSGIFNGFCSANLNESVSVNMYSPINLTPGDIFRIEYESSVAGTPCNPVTGLALNGNIIQGEPAIQASINLLNPVTQDTNFEITYEIQGYGPRTLTITVPNGFTSGNLEDSLGGLSTEPPTVLNYCVSSVNNNSITCNNFQCTPNSCPCGDS